MRNKSRVKIRRKAACIALTAVFGATLLAGQLSAFASPSSNHASQAGTETSYGLEYTNANGKVDLTGIKMDNLSKQVITNLNSEVSSQVKTVIVSLDGAPTSEGGNESAIKREQESFLNKLNENGISYDLKSSYSTVLNAVAIEVRLSALSSIKAMGGVSTVSVSSTYSRPKTVDGDDGLAQENFSKIYKNGIYDSSAYLDKYNGTGMTVAILDTGLDYTHEAFLPENLNDQSTVSFTKDDIVDKMDAVKFKATERSGATADDVYVNAKVPFAFDYADDDADVYPSYNQHGTHVAGIVAGKTKEDVHYTDKDGMDSGERFLGVAPEAQLVICKVFTDNLDDESIGGATTIDILDALEDCSNLDVDIINMSLGTTSGFSSAALGLKPEDDEGLLMNKVYTRVRDMGISLMVAASNDFSAGYGSAFGTNLATNPDSGTVGSPSTFDGAMSIASINGQRSHYIVANQNENGGSAVYYEESRSEDSDSYNFINDLLGEDDPNKANYDPNFKQSGTFKYVVIPGSGDTGDYPSSIRRELQDKGEGGKVIAVVKRGSNTFKEKIQIAKEKGADAVIVYNNVSGMVRMSLEDLEGRIPAISVSMDAGAILTGTGSHRRTTGTITIDRSYLAGPFMNDYSSWGTTPDLKLKPDVTAHGGEITSTVAGGYEEMSGTSMACPNLAGFTALLKGKLTSDATYKNLWTDKSSLTELSNNIMMSTAITVYDQNKLPYSPRKQGSGLATLDNVMNTKAYLYTKESDGYRTDKPEMTMYSDGRPKAEFGADTQRVGVYNVKFYVNNFGTEALSFKTNTIFMTETLGADGLSVAEKAHLFESKGVWTVDGKSVAEGGDFTVNAGSVSTVEVKLTLSDSDRKYLEEYFKENGMFIEGFLQLLSNDTAKQCNLTFPFMGFYGDWKKAPLLDYDCYEVAAFDKNTSYNDANRPKASVWATQAYSYYWNEKYATPLGSFLYLQDEDKEHTNQYIYPEADHVAISCFNDFYGDNDNNNYYSITGIRALYAGLLRNAELVTYTLTNESTGEVIPDENGNTVREIYRVRKAHSSGGSAVPAQVLLEMRTDEMGLDGGGKYRFDFEFYFEYEDREKGANEDNTFSMSFYVDYEAPVLVDSRIRFQDMKVNNVETQNVYLDLDIYDNHYPQAVILCYSETGDDYDVESIKLATEYITPVLNPKKNDTTTVSIDITEIYEEYKGKLYVELDDYAMNHNIYAIEIDQHAQTSVCPTDWVAPKNVTIDKNTAMKVELENIGTANLSNFIWQSLNPNVVKVKNGELFGVSTGTAQVIVRDGGNKSQFISVTVKDSNEVLKTPSVSFGTILNSEDRPVKAQNMVKVNPAQKFTLVPVIEPWYYPIETLEFEWESEDETLATVDKTTGEVTVLFEGDEVKTVGITATCKTIPSCNTSVTLVIQEPFSVSNNTLTRYRGWGGELKNNVLIGGQRYDNVRVLTVPDDKAIMTVAEDAFKDVEGVDVVIFPKTVTTISNGAFEDCVNLRKVCFISEEKITPADSSLTTISRYAFKGCTSLTTLDLSNCKVISVDRNVFTDCTSLKEIINMQAIGTAYAETFKGCTALEEVDLTYLHVAGADLFAGCTSLKTVTTGANTALSRGMFRGCTALESVEINCDYIPDGAFEDCTKLTNLVINANNVYIGNEAFSGCVALRNVTVANGASYVGDYAFRSCSNIQNIEQLQQSLSSATFGKDVFSTVDGLAEVIIGNKLITAAQTISSSDYLTAKGITEIGDYAFSGSMLSGVTTLDLTGITKIGKGAFYGLKLEEIAIDGVTEIADEAFAGTLIREITIPASVTKIGANAFRGCAYLSKVTFEVGGALEEIGGGAFNGTALTALELPDTVTKIGSYAFAENNALTSVVIPSAQVMGEGVFMNCTSLESATFGANATTTGEYTFFSITQSLQPGKSSLKSVTLGENITQIDTGAFEYCSSLQTINLGNVTVIGDEAFAGCTALTTVTGIEKVTEFGNHAFASCLNLTEVNLASAKKITFGSFFNCAKLRSVTFGSSLEGVGDRAFAGANLASVNIPASCEYIGASAFSCTAENSFDAFVVEEGNTHYFAKDGVLYRYVTDSTYELVSYPVQRTAKTGVKNLLYTVEEGTVAIGKYAFNLVPGDKVNAVVLPYTLKTVGHGAFVDCGIVSYTFESINAPVLLEEYGGRFGSGNYYSMNSYFYMNFVNRLFDLAPKKPGDTEVGKSEIAISYPENGKGYTNFVYSTFFGIKNVLEEMPEDNSRQLKSLIEGFKSADEVSAWSKEDPNNKEIKDQVIEFSNQVKDAHELYNLLTSDRQREYVGEENVAKLFAIEKALKPVKATFDIHVPMSEATVSTDSAHKTAYAIGETFSLSGLKIVITYEDFSQETIDAEGNFALAKAYDRPLRATDKLVNLVGKGDYAGLTLSVRGLEVSEGAKTEGGTTDKNSMPLIIGIVCCVVAIGAIVAVTLVLVLKKKKKAKLSDSSNVAAENAETEKGEESQATEQEGEPVEQEEQISEQSSENEGDGKTND